MTMSCKGFAIRVSGLGDTWFEGPHAVVEAQLFEPFVTTKEVGKGTGLGLAVCRGLVEAAGGSIMLDKEFGRGARFVIELPARTEP